MGKEESGDILRGTTLDIYRFLLKSSKPVGPREVQRALNLSSPSVADYHLAKLENACLIKKEVGNYVIDKVILENSIRIFHFVIPMNLFYAIFAASALFVALVFLTPNNANLSYEFVTVILFALTLALSIETVKSWIRNN